MELLFVSIENYRGQNELTFNLSNSHKFHYHFETGELEWDFIENNNQLFFQNSQISSLKAIVGQNGVGKTSFLELVQRLTYDFGSTPGRIVFGYRVDKKITIKYYGGNYDLPLNRPKLGRSFLSILKGNKWEVEISEYNHLRRRMRRGRRMTDSNFEGLEPFVDTIYFSNTYDGNSNFIRNKLNLSTNRLAGAGSYLSYQLKELSETIDFVSMGRELFDDSDQDLINIPESIIFDLNTDRRYNTNKINQFKDTGIEFREINSLMSKGGIVGYMGVHDYFLMHLGWRLLLESISALWRDTNGGLRPYFYPFNQDLKRILVENPKEAVDLFELILTALPKDFSLGEYSQGELEKLSAFFELSKKVQPLDIKNVSEFENPVQDVEVYLSEQSVEYIKSFTEMFRHPESIMRFRWRGRSSGEIAMLNLLSRFYSAKKNIRSESLIILIDECDLYLHPDWQRRYISVIVKYLSKIFPGKQLQIILTTHSPIILSDLTKENVIFLEKNPQGILISNKEKRNETFGANVHSLYNDSFFLNNGIIGSLAKGLINDVFDFLVEDQSKMSFDKKDVKTIIDNVGDRIVQTRLLELYGKKYELEIEREKLIHERQRIERQLKELDREDD